jgi:hypothetical protein
MGGIFGGLPEVLLLFIAGTENYLSKRRPVIPKCTLKSAVKTDVRF